MSKQPPPAPTASAVGPCPTVIQIVARPGTGSLPSTIAPPDHPQLTVENNKNEKSVKFQGNILNVCDFIQVYVFTTNHNLKCAVSGLFYCLCLLFLGSNSFCNNLLLY